MNTPVLGPASMGKTVVREARKPALHASQGMISGALLLAIRQTERQRGTLLAHHGRHPAALRPTQPRFHKITDRRARKLKARYIECARVSQQRFQDVWPGFEPNYDFRFAKVMEFKHAA